MGRSTEELEALLEDLRERLSRLEAEQEDLREENAQFLEEIVEVREEAVQLRRENAQLREALAAKDEKIDKLEARLRQYENPHTPPSKQRSTDDSDEDSEDTDDARTDGGTVGRNEGHDPAWRPHPDPDDEVDVTAEACPDCGESLAEAVGITPRFIEEIPDPDPIEITRYNLHHYQCECCDETVQATHPDCPAEGRFGPRVQAQAALARYQDRLPYRKIAQRFADVHDLELSPAAVWQATERIAEAGRAEYEQLREQIRGADVVHVDETGFALDGEQAWLWTFHTAEATLFALRASRGQQVLTEVLGEDFDGRIVCDGWSAYAAFSEDRQRCWAHLLREVDDVADDHADAASIAQQLHQLYDGLETFLASDPDERARQRMRDRARATLDEIVETTTETAAVADFIGKLERGLDHWLPFVTEPAVAPTNNAAENALREPIVLRKIIGTLRTESGRVTHETLLSLVATWRQNGANPATELQRVAQEAT